MNRVSAQAIRSIEEELVDRMADEFQLDLSQLLFDATNSFTFIDTFNGKAPFLEVDMGTETLVDPKGRWDRDLWGKVVVYRTYLGRQGYRRYESDGFFGTPLHGFRLLLVCASTQRTRAVCRMVAQNRPSDFVSVTAAPDLLRKGLGGYVWNRGGNLSRAGLAETVAQEKAANTDAQRSRHPELRPRTGRRSRMQRTFSPAVASASTTRSMPC